MITITITVFTFYMLITLSKHVPNIHHNTLKVCSAASMRSVQFGNAQTQCTDIACTKSVQ